MNSAPRPGVMGDVKGLSPVVVTILFERIVPDRPTPPERLAITPHKADSKTQSEEEEADEDVQAAARLIQRVDRLPNMRLLPSYNKYDLNRIAAENAVYRVNAALSGSDAS